MKYSCDMVKDLLPLYHDNVCSEASKKIVEEHLSECSSCRNIMEKMDDNTNDDHLKRERENVIGNYTKEVKRKSMLAGISIASVLSVPILVCLIVNIATGHALDWFFYCTDFFDDSGIPYRSSIDCHGTKGLMDSG